MARKLILVLFALIIAGTTVWFVRNWAGNQGQTVVQTVTELKAEPVKPTVKILVAASDLPAGTLVRDEHVTWQAWPEDESLEDKYIVENKRPIEELIGTVVRQGIANGEPVTDGRLVKPGQSGFLAAVLRPGTRAISIEVDATSGVAGFVFPGDRVDMILTMDLAQANEGENVAASRASETILTDVRVVAMDQSTDDQTQEASIRRVATLEVSPKEAEMVSVSRELGRLSLSLRSIARIEDGRKNADGSPVMKKERGRGYTRDSDVSALISAPNVGGTVARKVIIFRAGKLDQQSFE
ncbi:Flp pilus assembly protein CpaB [Sneathiella aquimaris]|uniref:Flp pilus assembly protein CpaB n=1 Tax=Sneathiella aquimaris TaxID=2599305 RepID=UPI00146BBC36|nr:Flp pilus assembly protein CpaB [Sneathiella aquimaris]